MPNIITPDVTSQNQTIEVTELIVIYTGMENASLSLNVEIPTDNEDGTYTFTNAPKAVFIEGALTIPLVNYTMDGLNLTALIPSGTGLNIQSFY